MASVSGLAKEESIRASSHTERFVQALCLAWGQRPKGDRSRDSRKMLCEDRGRDQSDAATSLATVKVARSQQKLLEPSEPGPGDTMIADVLPPEL